jgi:hypothetical protein
MRRREADLHICELILDISPVHVMASVQMHAQLLGFNVHFIASGWTDDYQLLDRSVLGAIKSTGRADAAWSVPGRSAKRMQSVFCLPPGASVRVRRSKQRGASMMAIRSSQRQARPRKGIPQSDDPNLKQSLGAKLLCSVGIEDLHSQRSRRCPGLKGLAYDLPLLSNGLEAMRAPARYHDFGN